jgi:hypothetical protein
MGILSEEFGLSNWIDCENQPNNSPLKHWDIEYGIDFVAQGPDGESLAFQVRNSKFDCFTLRETSRGYKAEVLKRGSQLKGNKYPFPSKSCLTIHTHVDETFSKIKSIMICGSEELFEYVEKGGKVKRLVSGVDGNSFIVIAPKDLVSAGIGVTILEVSND